MEVEATTPVESRASRGKSPERASAKPCAKRRTVRQYWMAARSMRPRHPRSLPAGGRERRGEDRFAADRLACSRCFWRVSSLRPSGGWVVEYGRTRRGPARVL